MIRATATLGHLAALLLLWRWAPGGWPSLCALLAVAAPIAARTRSARVTFGVIDALVVIGATVAEVLAARSAASREAALVVALARGLVLAGAAGSRRAVPGASAAFVVGPVAFAVLGAGTLAGESTTLLDALLALVALGAAAASLASAHEASVELSARATRGVSLGGGRSPRPLAGLAALHGAASIVLFLVALAAPRDLRAPATRASASAGTPASRAAIGVTPEVVFDGSGAPSPSEVEVVATVRFDQPTDELRGLFLRAAALERLDDEGFHRSEQLGPPGGANALAALDAERIDSPRPFKMTVALRSVAGGFLLAMGSPRSIEGARAVRDRAGNLLLPPGVRAPDRYTLRALEATDEDAALQERAAAEAPGLHELPSSVRDDADLQSLAARLARGATTAHGRARAIERRLAGDYDYDLGSSHRTRGLARSVRRFLFEERRGACTEFATAMVVLLRLLDVPARLVIGYHVGRSERSADGTWTVYQSTAHAWVEVPLEGAGFVTYDPTAPTRSAPESADPATTEEPASGALASVLDRVSGRTALGLAALLAVAAVVATVALEALRRARLGHERRRPSARSLEPRLVAASAALLEVVERRGYRIGGAETLLAFARGLAERADATARDHALVRAVRLYYAVRFSGRPVSERVISRLRQRIEAAKSTP